MNVIGPIPQMVMAAGSVPLALTPSWCGVRATRRTKVPTGADTVSVGIEFVAARHPPGAGDNDAIAVGLGRARQRTST
jgi:hypothetical protein